MVGYGVFSVQGATRLIKDACEEGSMPRVGLPATSVPRSALTSPRGGAVLGAGGAGGCVSRTLETQGNVQPSRAHNRSGTKRRLSVRAGMMEPAFLRCLPPERSCVLAGEEEELGRR